MGPRGRAAGAGFHDDVCQPSRFGGVNRSVLDEEGGPEKLGARLGMGGAEPGSEAGSVPGCPS